MAHDTGNGHALFDTALGPIGLAWSATGLVAVQLPEAADDPTGSASRALTAERLAARVAPGSRADLEAPAWVAEAGRTIAEHLAGDMRDMTGLPVDLSGVPEFHARVYAELRAVPAGRTTTYAELAARAGSPGAARAVGRAMATNPVPLVVPCHRVLAAGGRPGGFSAPGGLATKERLLVLEGARLDFELDPRAGPDSESRGRSGSGAR